MKEYNLVARVTISVFTTVEAETEQEAIELAGHRPLMEIPRDNFYTSYEY